LRAYCSQCRDDPEQALADLDQVVRLRPDDPRVDFDHSNLLLENPAQHISDIDSKCIDMGLQRLMAATFSSSRSRFGCPRRRG